MTLIASFLVGSLLSLLLPTLMLIALVFWYLKFVSSVPETGAAEEPVAPAETEGPELSHTTDRIN